MATATRDATIDLDLHNLRVATKMNSDRACIEPSVLARPQLNEGIARKHEVENEGRVYTMSCVDSMASGASYAFIRTLRPAIYGKVKLAVALDGPQSNGTYSMSSQQTVAIKIIRKEKLNGKSQEDPLKEIAVMQTLVPGHPNVMGLVEVLHDAGCIYLVLPFCDGGEICQWFERTRYMLREPIAREFFLQILAGLTFLHEHGVVHRDMSLENLLYDAKTKRCIIIDLGMCIKLPVPATSDLLVRRQGYCGKLTYMSPEIYKNSNFRAAAIDVWPLGVILFIMLTGIPPVETPSAIDPRYRMLEEGRLFELMDLWKITSVSAAAKDLLRGMLEVDAARRMSVAQIARHPWTMEASLAEMGARSADHGNTSQAASREGSDQRGGVG